MASTAITDVLVRRAEKLARLTTAVAARTDPGGNIASIPGTRFERWERVEPKAEPWRDHTDLEGTVQQRTEFPQGWPGLNANQTSPARPHGHKGCGHETFIDNVAVTFGATKPDVNGDTVTILFSIGTEPGVTFRYRSGLVAAAAKRVQADTVRDGITAPRVAWAKKRVRAALTQLT